MSYTLFQGSEKGCFFLWREEVVSGGPSHFLAALGILGFLSLEEIRLHYFIPSHLPMLQMVKPRLLSK